MPGGDRTGPAGMGPMTGRAAGYCAGYPVPGYMNPIPGYGFGGRGRGRGGGWGRRNWYYATGLTGWQRTAQVPPVMPVPPVPPAAAAQQEIEILRSQVAQTEQMLAELKQRLDEIQPSTVEKTPP